MWPEIVAEKLNLDHVNIGKSGEGNDFIINNTIRALLDNGKNVEVVMILLSGWDRSLLFNSTSTGGFLFYLYNVIYKKYPVSNHPFIGTDLSQKVVMDHINQNRMFFRRFYNNSIKETLTAVYTLIHLCESRNIKYMFAQGIQTFDYWSLDKICNHFSLNYKIKRSDYLRYLASSGIGKELEKRSDYLIGWPFEAIYGGYSIDYFRKSNKGKFKDIPIGISEMDPHPNSEEQKVIADIFYEKYMELYCK